MSQNTDLEAREDLLQWTAERAAERVIAKQDEKKNPYPQGSEEYAKWDRFFEDALSEKKYGLD